MANQLRVNWPADRLCNSCFYTAMRTHGICPTCGHDGVLPGRARGVDPRPVCMSCAGIAGNYRCATCHAEGQLYRGGQCARCALRDDLTALMVDGAADPVTMGTIVTILCGVDRPESILTWKRSPSVKALLTGLAGGDIPLSHDGLDAAGQSRQVSHLRSLLEHNGLLQQRDEPLARFQTWLAGKLDAISEPAVRAPVEQFATWHHLNRLRRKSTSGQTSHGPTHSARQAINDTLKFPTWLYGNHHRAAATCRQQDIDEWLATGPTTRTKVRTFVVWANKSKINAALHLDASQAKNTRLLTQDQRLSWIKVLYGTTAVPFCDRRDLANKVALPRAPYLLQGRSHPSAVTAQTIPDGRRPPVDRRTVVEATAWRFRTGAPWRDVPERFGNWNTIYKNFNQWSEQGV